MKSVIRHATAVLAPYLPPIVRRSLTSLYPGTYSGNFASWSEALEHSQGYDSPTILDKVRDALLKVRDGNAAGERDSVAFDEVPYSYPVLAALLRSALMNDDYLHVVDFGGSLGSTYFQFRAFAPRLRRLEWSVVEQSQFVSCGRKDFANDQLSFYESVADCLRGRPPQVLLLSSVLTYLPNPYDLLVDSMRAGFQSIVVDRTLFRESIHDRLCVQNVPKEIYPGSYPAWLLSRAKFLATLAPEYRRIAEFQTEHTEDFERVASKCLGFIFDSRGSNRRATLDPRDFASRDVSGD